MKEWNQDSRWKGVGLLLFENKKKGWVLGVWGQTEVKSWVTVQEGLAGVTVFCCSSGWLVEFCLHTLSTPWIILFATLPIHCYMCLTPSRILVTAVHHYILSISDNAWYIVKCLVNIGLMNKWPRWGTGCINGEERAFNNYNQQDKNWRIEGVPRAGTICR